MTSISIDLPEAMNEYLEQQVHTGRFKDRSSVVQDLIAEAVRNQWRREADDKLRESLAEFERGEGVRWKKGDCERMVREYLKRKKSRNGKRS